MRRLLIGAGLLVAILVPAYLLVPWWMPTGWLAARISQDLSLMLGWPVEVGAVSLDWSDGVVIRDIMLPHRDTRGGVLIRIREVRCGLTPMRWLAGRGLDRLELREPAAYVQINPDGALNLSVLRPQPGQPVTGHWIVSDTSVHFVNALQKESPVVRIGTFELQLDPATGRAAVRLADGALLKNVHWPRDSGAWSMDATLTAPGEARGPAAEPALPMGGEGEFKWERVDLSTIPIRWWRGAGNASLTGRCSGVIRGRAGDDLRPMFDVEATLDGVRFVQPENALAISKGGVKASVRWDPVQDTFSFERMVVSLPGASLTGRGRGAESGDALPLEYSSRTGLVSGAHFRATVSDFSECRGWWPTGWTAPVTALGGGAVADLDWTRRDGQDRLEVRAQGRAFECDGVGGIRVHRDQVCELAVASDIDAKQGTVRIERLAARVGGMRVRGSGHFRMLAAAATATSRPMDASRAAAWVRTLADVGAHAEVAFDAMEDIERFRPGFTALVAGDRGGPATVSGPGGVTIDLRNADGKPRIDTRIGFDSLAHVSIPGTFEKAPGQPLAVTISATPVMEGRDIVACVGLRAVYGDSQLDVTEAASTVRICGNSEASDYGSCELQWTARHVEGFLPLIPPAAWSQRVDRLAGSALGTIRARIARAGEGEWRCSIDAESDLSALGIAWGRVLSKPRGDAARMTLDCRLSGSRGRIAMDRAASRVESPAGVLTCSLAMGADESRGSMDMLVNDLARVASLSPALADQLKRVRMHGPARLKLGGLRREGLARFALDVDGTDAAFTLAGDEAGGSNSAAAPAFYKGTGTALRASLEVEQDGRTSEGLRVGPCVVQIGATRVDVTGGFVSMSADVSEAVRRLDAERLREGGWGKAIESVRLRGRAHVDADDMRGRIRMAGLSEWARIHALEGRVAGEWDLWFDRNGLWTRGEAHASGVAFGPGGGFAGCSGRSLSARWDAGLHGPSAAPTGDADGMPAGASIRRLQLTSDSIELETRGDIRWDERGALNGTLHAALNAGDLSDLNGWGVLKGIKVESGGCRARVEANNHSGKWQIRDVRARFDGATVIPEGHLSPNDAIVIDGAVYATPSEVRSQGLTLWLGRSSISVGGRLRGSPQLLQGMTGEFAANSPDFNFQQAQATMERWARRLRDIVPDAGRAGPEWTEIPRELRDYAARSSVRGEIRFRRAYIPHLANAGPFEPEELVLNPSMVSGTVRLPFRCAVSGGTVIGSIETRLDAPNPYFDLRYEARRLASEENVRPIVERFFQGLTVTGPITLIDRTHQRLFDEPGVPNPAVGDGEMILEGGTVVGRAAPKAITAIFPGLNLARFDYTRMINRFNKRRDGRTDNDMLFFGPYYDMYVDGSTYADGRIRYEVGVDLYADLAPNISNSKQGRIALFIKTARRGEGAALEDETVSYLRPDQVLAKILSDNPLTQTYHGLKARLTKAGHRPPRHRHDPP